MDWIECESCSMEFKVLSDVLETVSFCPFCGDDVKQIDDDYDEEFEEDDY